MSTYMAGRVAKGAKALDRIKPDWFKRIDLKTLDLQFADRCVLGQLYGMDDKAPFGLWERAEHLGFFVVCASSQNEHHWKMLTDGWKSAIQSRLQKDRAVVDKAMDLLMTPVGMELLAKVLQGMVEKVPAA